MGEVQKIIKTITRTFTKNAWHGPAVLEVIEGVDQQSAQKRLPNTHSVIELVTHMTAWRIFTVRKLMGDSEYEVSEQMNFPTLTDWSTAKRQLLESQEQMLKALNAFPDEKLSELVPYGKGKYTYYTLLNGIAHHDLYHAGQIMLILKATT